MHDECGEETQGSKIDITASKLKLCPHSSTVRHNCDGLSVYVYVVSLRIGRNWRFELFPTKDATGTSRTAVGKKKLIPLDAHR